MSFPHVPNFIDLETSEQAQELKAHLKSLGAPISEEASDDFFADLKAIVNNVDHCWNANNDNDVEPVLNSIISLLLMLKPADCEQYVTPFCQKLSEPREKESTSRKQIRMKVFNNLFNALNQDSPYCYIVYYHMVKLVANSRDLLAFKFNLDQLKIWLATWKVGSEKSRKLLRAMYDSLMDCSRSELAIKVMVELLSSYTEENASQARDDAHRCIVTSLADPECYLLDHLLSLKPVKFLEGELIHELLTIFVSGSLQDYLNFYTQNKDFIESLGLDHEKNTNKMRLLTFMGMSTDRTEITFDVLEKKLELPTDQVENFIIKAVRTKLVRARIDEIQKSVIVSSSVQRTFGKQQWFQLREKLDQWSKQINRVCENLHSLEIAPV